MNGAVLDPDKVCPTCQSSAFELPSGSRPQAPVLCGGCRVSLGPRGAFRLRVGRVLLLQPTRRQSRQPHLNPLAESRVEFRAR
jgi:hypothetical protein